MKGITVKTIKKHSGFTLATDGTYTMDGTADCFPVSTNFTSDGITVGEFNEIGIYVKCTTDFTVAVVTKYQVSFDGTNWMDGQNSITYLDTGVEEWITLHANEKGVNWIRFNANNTNAELGTVFIVLTCKA